MQLDRIFGEAVRTALRRNPIAGLIGPRQVGKTTLARQLFPNLDEGHFIDLEDPDDRLRMESPKLALSGLRGTVIIDEVQRAPDLFPYLRVLADRPGVPARFLILGSASPDLLRQSSESLAGRVEYIELPGLTLAEIGTTNIDKLWERGGFPRSFLAADGADSLAWRRAFVRTFVERDLGAMGFGVRPPVMERLWRMLAHYHGQTLNTSEIGRNLGFSHHTIRSYIDVLQSAFMVRQLQPWFENVGKRQVKAPKLYFRDTGLLHALLNLESLDSLKGHPRLGASWEGFVIEQILATRENPEDAYFWATHAGAEIDLLLHHKDKRIGIEIKYAGEPRPTRSIAIARADLNLSHVYIIHPSTAQIEFPDNTTALPLSAFLQVIA